MTTRASGRGRDYCYYTTTGRQYRKTDGEIANGHRKLVDGRRGRGRIRVRQVRTEVQRARRARAAQVRAEKVYAFASGPGGAARHQDRHAAVAVQVPRVWAQIHERQRDDGPYEAATLAEKRARAVRVPHVPKGGMDPRAARGAAAPGAADRRAAGRVAAAGRGLGRGVIVADRRLGRGVDRRAGRVAA